MEDYKKKYKEALGRAKSIINVNPSRQNEITNIMFNVFPELKESEDEVIRKVLIDYFNRYKEQEECGVKTFYGIPTDNILAWLEKQGERKVVVPKFRVGDTIRHKSGDDTSYTIIDIVNGNYLCERNHAWSISSQDYFELVEQKPVEWNEEDEEMLDGIIVDIEVLKGQNTTKDGRALYQKEIDWIKSIRPQNRWKPSDEMLEALYRVIPENVMEISEDEMLLDKLYQGLKYGKVLSEK